MRRHILVFLWWVIGIACLNSALQTGMGAFSAWKLNEIARTWPAADAKIVNLSKEVVRRYVGYSRMGRFENSTHYHCLYEYKVGDKVYTSDHIAANRNDSRELKDLKVGDVLTVHYNPRNPEQVLATTSGFYLGKEIGSIIGMLIFGTIILGLAFNKVDPFSDFSKAKGGLAGNLEIPPGQSYSADDANKEIGSTVKQMILVVVFFVMLAVGATMWKTDMREKNWKNAAQ